MEEDGTLPTFDPTNVSHILNRASERGYKAMIMYDAMDLIRSNPQLTNEEAIIECAKKWKVI